MNLQQIAPTREQMAAAVSGMSAADILAALRRIDTRDEWQVTLRGLLISALNSGGESRKH